MPGTQVCQIIWLGMAMKGSLFKPYFAEQQAGDGDDSISPRPLQAFLAER